ncbi:MAG: Zn-ribbon domain-containing OB-fold protein [Acidimicrobiales bacterium]
MALPSIAPSALRVDEDGQATLLGGWSATSGLRHFPPAPVCPFTGADDVTPLDLPRAGTVWLHTTVHAPPPGYAGPVPYGLGVVELDGDPLLRVVTRLAAEGVAVGDRVHLHAEEVPGPDGDPVLTWSFRR